MSKPIIFEEIDHSRIDTNRWINWIIWGNPQGEMSIKKPMSKIKDQIEIEQQKRNEELDQKYQYENRN